MVSIHIQKKDLWLLSAIVVFLVGAGYVLAYGSGQPTVHGHDAGEVEGIGATYIGSWQSISAGGITSFNHGLGTDELIITLQFKPTLTSAISMVHSSDYAGTGYGVGIYEISNTQIKVSGGSGDLRYWKADGAVASGGGSMPSSGYVRVIATAV